MSTRQDSGILLLAEYRGCPLDTDDGNNALFQSGDKVVSISVGADQHLIGHQLSAVGLQLPFLTGTLELCDGTV